MQKVEEFLLNQATDLRQRSAWFDLGKMHIYLRVGQMLSYADAQMVLGVCVSNVCVDERFRRKGVFLKFIENMSAFGRPLGYVELQVEHAISPEMVSFCQKHEMNIKPALYGSAGYSYWRTL